MDTNSPLQPPAPFADFEFTFDPSISEFFPPPPPIPIPSSADLFSQSETTDLLGFLDNFNWEFDADPLLGGLPSQLPQELPPPPAPSSTRALPPYTNPHQNTSPEPSTSNVSASRNGSRATRSGSTRTKSDGAKRGVGSKSAVSRTRSSNSETPVPDGGATNSASSVTPTPTSASEPRAKSLLSTPQKRLNHIMSEQKRRNAIRDGYAQLIQLLAPAGAGSGIGMPTRGRPKGSGSKGKGKTKGKSGVLFRAVEYVRWLEEGRDALLEEVLRTEAAVGMRHQ